MSTIEKRGYRKQGHPESSITQSSVRAADDVDAEQSGEKLTAGIEPRLAMVVVAANVRVASPKFLYYSL